jgi:pimeloyl-ACP methyl ester carboxylesterase
MPATTIDGIKINYVIKGAGPHLLMFAPGGFNATLAQWTKDSPAATVWKDMDAIETLSKHFTVIAYDRRESGYSGGRVEPLTWDAYVREAKGMLDLAGANQSYVLGGCMGVSLANAFALRQPAMCKGLILHWPVGGYGWMLKARSVFDIHIEFVRRHGLAAAAARATDKKSFWNDPESGPWASVIAADPAFAADYVKHDLKRYLGILGQSRDTLFPDTMPSGATGAELMTIRIPALIMSGGDRSHTISASWALKELMPNAERWDVVPPDQNAANVLEQILKFKTRVDAA